MTQYFVIRIQTCDEDGASTDATVSLTIYGTKGQYTMQDLDTDDHDDFERGHVDMFKRATPDIGKMTGFELSHDNSGDHPGWKPCSITIVNFGIGSDAQRAMENYYNNPRLDDKTKKQYDWLNHKIDVWLSKDNDGYMGNCDDSLKYKYMLPTPPILVVTPPSGVWKDYPTGVIAAINIVRENGTTIQSQRGRGATLRLTATESQAQSNRKELGTSLEVKGSYGSEESPVSIEVTAGVTASLASEVQKQYETSRATEAVQTEQMTFTMPIHLEENEIALVLYEAYEVRRSKPGMITLGKETAYFNDCISYNYPVIEKYMRDDPKLHERIMGLMQDPTTHNLISRVDLEILGY